MAIQNKIDYCDLSDLYLDASNPRLGRQNTERKLSQEKVLDAMKDWTLNELAFSFLESGFWPQEALLVVEELIKGQKRLVVIEGNRRLAALKLLKLAFDGNPGSKTWRETGFPPKAAAKSLLGSPHSSVLAAARMSSPSLGSDTSLGSRNGT